MQQTKPTLQFRPICDMEIYKIPSFVYSLPFHLRAIQGDIQRLQAYTATKFETDLVV